MITITPATAISLVRKNMDEAGLNESVMYTDEYNDNLSLDDIIRKSLPEAINAVHLLCPVTLLEGERYTFTTSGSRPEGENIYLAGNVLVFSPSVASQMLRLVAFRAVDSGIVVTDVIPEASPEGRKQLNPYVCGTYDRPRLVRAQGETTPPLLKYYSLKGETVSRLANPASAISLFSFVREQFYDPVLSGYNASRYLRQNIIDRLTAMVMEIYGMQSAGTYYERSTSF